MKNKISIKSAGRIKLSDKVVVSDPCYDRNAWCMATDIAVKPGEYVTFIVKSDEGNWGVRVAAVIAVHVDYLKSLRRDWDLHEITIGVDSGQCGIFDDTIYPTVGDSSGEYDDENSFYGECCKLTLSDARFGILKACNGIVTSSGIGDGSYGLLSQHHEGERAALMIDYSLVSKKAIVEALTDFLEINN